MSSPNCTTILFALLVLSFLSFIFFNEGLRIFYSLNDVTASWFGPVSDFAASELSKKNFEFSWDQRSRGRFDHSICKKKWTLVNRCQVVLLPRHYCYIYICHFYSLKATLHHIPLLLELWELRKAKKRYIYIIYPKKKEENVTSYLYNWGRYSSPTRPSLHGSPQSPSEFWSSLHCSPLLLQPCLATPETPTIETEPN